MNVDQQNCHDDECWSEDDVDSQFPAYYFNFEKPTDHQENLTDQEDCGNPMRRNKNDPLLHLPCRILDDWYLRLKPQRSLPYFTLEQKMFPHGRVPLPLHTPDLDKYILGGKLKPQRSGQDPIHIELDELDFYTIDTSKGFRGYWVVTSQARYWLRNPCSKVLEIAKVSLRVDGENVLAWDDERDAYNKGNLKAQLPSQEQLHQLHGTQLGLFCDILDLMIRADGTYSSFIHKLSFTQLNKILTWKHESAMRAMTTKSMQGGVCRNLTKESRLLVPHLRVVDSKLEQSLWFQELVATCDDNHSINVGPNQSTVSESHRVESLTTAEVQVNMDRWNETERQGGTSSASESSSSLSGGADQGNKSRNLLSYRPLAPLELNKDVMALLSRPPKVGDSRPSIRQQAVTAVATSMGIADDPRKVSKVRDSAPKTSDNHDSLSVGSLPPSNPVTNGIVGAGTQQSSSIPQSPVSLHSPIDRRDDRIRANPAHSNASLSSSVLTREPQGVISPSSHPPSNPTQCGQPPDPIESSSIRDTIPQVFSLGGNTATANSSLPTIPKKPRMTGLHPQSTRNNQPTRGYPVDRQRYNSGSSSLVPGNTYAFAEDRQPDEISRTGSPLKFQDASPWKRQKMYPSELRQNVAPPLEVQSTNDMDSKPGVQPYHGVQHPGRVNRLQVPSRPPIRGYPIQMTQNTSFAQPPRMGHSLPPQEYPRHPVHPGYRSLRGTWQVPRRPDYPTSNRFADRQYYCQHQATQSQQVTHPFVRRHEDFQTGRNGDPSGMDNDKTAQYLVGIRGKRSLEVFQQEENRTSHYRPSWHS